MYGDVPEQTDNLDPDQPHQQGTISIDGNFVPGRSNYTESRKWRRGTVKKFYVCKDSVSKCSL